MEKLCKYIIAGALSFVILFFACMPPGYALGIVPSVDIDVVDFIQWVYGELDDTKTTIWNKIKHLVDDDVCASAPSVGGLHNFVERRTQVDGRTGLFYICQYCGRSAGEVAEDVYANYVADLPATGFTSDGHFIWNTMYSFAGSGFYYASGNDSKYYKFDSLPWYYDHYDSRRIFALELLSSQKCLKLTLTAYSGFSSVSLSGFYFNVTAPISGTYFLMKTPAHNLHLIFAMLCSFLPVQPIGQLYSLIDYFDFQKRAKLIQGYPFGFVSFDQLLILYWAVLQHFQVVPNPFGLCFDGFNYVLLVHGLLLSRA